MRTEFGVQRTSCSCEVCIENCRKMPGFLIPPDLDRLIPAGLKGREIYAWAEKNLLASPGALVGDTSTRKLFRIHTLVPATKPDGSCIHLTVGNRCAIHADAPFGCAFFDCGPDPRYQLSAQGMALINEFFPQSLYGLIWKHLWESGRRQRAPEELRKKGANHERGN